MEFFTKLCLQIRTSIFSWLGMLLLMLLLCCTNSVYARSHLLSGKVVDQKGVPVVGANVIVPGTTVGTNTDLEGAFSLSLDPDVHKKISVSFLGYETQTLTIGAKTYVSVILKETSDNIEEVVVVAYGTQKKVAVTGSVASVGNTDLKKAPVSNFTTSLAGRLPGLNVSQNSGMPGDERVELNLRGVSTISGDAAPLILIDGVPRDDLSSLDADEVENVTVLKDASATGVFGVRGANGVILVTTRRGNVGKPSVSINVNYGIQQILTGQPYHLNSWDYAELLNERNVNSGLAPAYNEWQINRFRSGEDPIFFPNRNPMDEYTKIGQQFKINANVIGGTKRIKYFINASYQDQGSVFKTLPKSVLGYDPSFWLKRINVRANIDYNINENLKFSLNLSSYLNKRNMVQWGDGLIWSSDLDFNSPVATYIMGTIKMTPPTAPGPGLPANAVDKNGRPIPQYGWIFDGSGYQLYPRMNLGGYIRQMKSTLNSSLALDWNMQRLVKGLKMKVMLSYDVYATGFTRATKSYNCYSFHQATGPDDESYFELAHSDEAFDGQHAETSLNFLRGGRGQSSMYKFNTQLAINYDRLFGSCHDVHVMLLGQMDNYVSNAPSSLYMPYNMLYLSGRATYTYDNRYTAELNVGVNGSEQFAKGNRFGIFPAVSLGWTVSEEKFIKDHVDTKWLDFLKLRASYGIVGNDRMGDTRFLYMDDVRVVPGGLIPTLGRGNYVSTKLLGNHNLTWERAEQWNFGVDVGFLNGFTFNFDYFTEDRSNILLSRSTIPLVQGFGPQMLPRVNMGRVRNRGYELVLNYQKQINRDLLLMCSFNYNFARNKVIAADEVRRPTGPNQYLSEYVVTGHPIGTEWVLKVDYEDGAGNGFINTPEDLEKYSHMYSGYARAFLGQWKFQDLNGDGKINDKDKVPCRYSATVPEITYGMNFSMKWKNFDFSMLWQGVAHREGVAFVGMFGKGYVTGKWELNAWTKERFENKQPITYQALNMGTLADAQNLNERSDYVVSDRSFIRLKNLELGYSLPKKWVKKMGLGNVRFAIIGQNLWNTSNLKAKEAMDPEQDNENQYPLTRNISFSISLKL